MRTITAPGEIDRIFSQGQRSASAILLVMAVRTPEARDHDGRVLFVAGKRLGPAVHRNRSKRVMREAARRSDGPWPGWDVALIARRATGATPADELDAALMAALRRLGVRG